MSFEQLNWNNSTAVCVRKPISIEFLKRKRSLFDEWTLGKEDVVRLGQRAQVCRPRETRGFFSALLHASHNAAIKDPFQFPHQIKPSKRIMSTISRTIYESMRTKSSVFLLSFFFLIDSSYVFISADVARTKSAIY